MSLTDPNRAKVYIAYVLALTLVSLAFITTLSKHSFDEMLLWAFVALIGGLLGADVLSGGG